MALSVRPWGADHRGVTTRGSGLERGAMQVKAPGWAAALPRSGRIGYLTGPESARSGIRSAGTGPLPGHDVGIVRRG